MMAARGMGFPSTAAVLVALLPILLPTQAFPDSQFGLGAFAVQDGPTFEAETRLGHLGNSSAAEDVGFGSASAGTIPVEGYTKRAEITAEGARWTVYEDVRSRDGNIVFQKASGEQRVYHKYTEPSFWVPHPRYPKYLGKSMRDIGLGLRDILADELLRDGEPGEDRVAAIIPPLGVNRRSNHNTAASWTSLVGNVHAIDTMPVFSYGDTRTYRPMQLLRVNEAALRHDGNVGGWLPAVRKINPVTATTASAALNPNVYDEFIIFGDVESKDPFMVQHWVRTSRIENGRATKVVYGLSYPEFRPTKLNPKPEEFYTAFFRFSSYWQKHIGGMSPVTLPDSSWTNLAKYAFVKELMVRPFGVYPKYGAVDRDYYGSEYDGFQDTFTSSVSANLEWGRFNLSRAVIDNYFDYFVGDNGAVNMRGPEIAQFGMTLSLLTKYARYTGDIGLLDKYKAKIIKTANSLVALHDESLALPQGNPGHGLIHGWSESDASLVPNPSVYWKPYFANSAFSARGLRDISSLPLFKEQAPEWIKRADQLLARTVQSMKASVFSNRNPPYMPPLPGTRKTFRESMATDQPQSEQAWPHRLYAELVHAAVLPPSIANQVHDTMRAYGATSLGVVANVGAPNAGGRDILGFISYGHAYSLLLLDRTDEFVLFLYSHRYHAHTRGAWNALEVAPINGAGGTFCMPAQLTIPSILRWALVLEHPDNDIVYFGRGVPRAWLGTGKPISIKAAPTRFGRVDYEIKLDTATNTIKTAVKFAKQAPKKVEIKLRAPKGRKILSVMVNNKAAQLQKNEAVLVDGAKEVMVEAKLA